jgi:hypothetical protein
MLLSLRGWRSQERGGSSPPFRTTFIINKLQESEAARHGGLCCHVVKTVVNMSAIFGFRSILQQVERSSDARATRLGVGRELHYLYGARRPARFSRYAVPLRFLAIFECGG